MTPVRWLKVRRAGRQRMPDVSQLREIPDSQGPAALFRIIIWGDLW
jgi:hypothetical protein